MLLQSLRALCKAPGGPGSIWKYLEALVRATGVSGRFACCFRTDLHFADVRFITTHLWIPTLGEIMTVLSVNLVPSRYISPIKRPIQ